MLFSFLHFLIYQTCTFINYQLCIFSPSINFLIIFMTSSFLKIKRTTRYPIPESTTLTNSSTVLWSFHKLTILQMQITATVLIPTVIKFLLNILILQICRLSCLQIANIMLSAINVVNAVAISLQFSIKIKFNPTLTIALIIVAIRITFSFCAGNKTHWLYIHPYIQDIKNCSYCEKQCHHWSKILWNRTSPINHLV